MKNVLNLVAQDGILRYYYFISTQDCPKFMTRLGFLYDIHDFSYKNRGAKLAKMWHNKKV
jgi:hypothetical protein